MQRTTAILLTTLGVAACSTAPSKNEETTQAINGTDGVFDYTIDLPWRMEPRLDELGRPSYDPIPITIAIVDEDTNAYSQIQPDIFHPTPQRLGVFCGLSIASVDAAGEHGDRTFFKPTDLSWIEVTGRDPNDSDRPAYWPYNSPVTPWHGVCHPGSQDCSEFLTVFGTSEWHAQLMLPWDGLPGANHPLELIAWVSRADRGCAEDERIALRTYARIHWGPEPLPNFGDGWLYGDLHYHSQSTDNEGETGHAYRAVATTLAAMGIDFAFATDHASNSRQIVDIDPISLEGLAVEHRRGVRDLSQPRWDSAQQYLHGPDGANAEGARFAKDRPRVPRLFLGAEVDVMPEVLDPPTGDGWLVPYGNGLSWNLFAPSASCEGWIPALANWAPCPLGGLPQPFTDATGQQAFAVRDVQGLDELRVGRQHLLYIPRFRDVPNGLVPSDTTDYGGASRHLIESNGVLDEIAAKRGLAFLAHPLDARGEDKGPAIVPYSRYQYEKIFAHPAFTGLQLWNEDVRVESTDGDFQQGGYSFVGITSSGNIYPGILNRLFSFVPVASLAGWSWSAAPHDTESLLHHGTAQWDELLRWGLDLARTGPIDWVPTGEPRKLFMAGGSDAHGDFNFRRKGYVTGADGTNDTALARVRNLVDVGAVRGECSSRSKDCTPPPPTVPGHSQDQVAEAIGAGRFSVTDGPALRMVVDRNRNGVIDAPDSPMGSVIDLFPGEQLPLLIEARSTSEFGPLERVDLYVGVDSNPPAACGGTGCADPERGRTYAPVDHGVRSDHYDNTDDVRVADTPALDCGSGVCRMADGYWLPAAGARNLLRRDASQLVNGLWAVSIDTDAFPVGPNDSRPTRLYVRAFTRTRARCTVKSPGGSGFLQNCSPRYAYTNPIWALRKVPGPGCPVSDRALDTDLDGLPDHCDVFPGDPAAVDWTRAFGG